MRGETHMGFRGSNMRAVVQSVATAGAAGALLRRPLALSLVAGVAMAIGFGATPARADLVRDLLGVNPFAKQSESGLREGVYVDDSGEEIVCPRVDVLENGSFVRRGEGAGLSYQLTIGNLARECVPNPAGGAVVNVGVDVRAVLGPAGRPGNFSSPMTIQLKRGGQVLSRITRQVTVNVPAGEGNGVATLIESGISLPEDTHNLLIEVGFGGAQAKKSRGRNR